MKIQLATMILLSSLSGFAQNSDVEKILTSSEYEEIQLSSPQFKGIDFLAVTPSESANQQHVAAQFDRAKKICNFLGYSNPSLSTLSYRLDAPVKVLVVDPEKGISEAVEYLRLHSGYYYAVGVFKTLHCKK